MGRRNGKRRRVREKCGRQEAAGLRSRVPRRKRKPLLRAKREAEGKRKRKEGRKRNGKRDSVLAGCAVASPYNRGEEGSNGSGAEKERGRGLRGPLLPGGRPDTCSGHIVIKRLPTGPLMARDDILQVEPPSRGCA